MKKLKTYICLQFINGGCYSQRIFLINLSSRQIMLFLGDQSRKQFISKNEKQLIDISKTMHFLNTVYY